MRIQWNQNQQDRRESTSLSFWMESIQLLMKHILDVKPPPVVEFILINFNDNCAFFTEDANTLKKLSVELPSKIPLLTTTNQISSLLSITVTHCLGNMLELCLSRDVLLCLEVHFSKEEGEDFQKLLPNILI